MEAETRASQSLTNPAVGAVELRAADALAGRVIADAALLADAALRVLIVGAVHQQTVHATPTCAQVRSVQAEARLRTGVANAFRALARAVVAAIGALRCHPTRAAK